MNIIKLGCMFQLKIRTIRRTICSVYLFMYLMDLNVHDYYRPIYIYIYIYIYTSSNSVLQEKVLRSNFASHCYLARDILMCFHVIY